MQRHRYKEHPHAGGTFKGKFLGNPDVEFSDDILETFGHCYDVADSPGIDHGLDLTFYDGSNMPIINGSVPSGIFAGSEYSNFMPAGYSQHFDHIAIPDADFQGDEWNKLLARTNPSRPVVTPLTLIQDVIELPKMLKDVGRLLKNNRKNLTAKDIANQNLAIQFGWMPLVQDVKHLMELQSHIIKRNAEIHRLYSRGGLKRRITLGSGNAQDSYLWNYFPGGAGTVLTLKINRFTSAKKWGTVRWNPTELPPFQLDSVNMNRVITRAVTGLTPEGLFSGAWDVLPWSWIIDWFTNTGDYLLRNSNFIPARSSHACVMINRKTSVHCTKHAAPAWLDVSDGDGTFETKQRWADGSNVIARVPHIGLRRLSILGSLFIQKFK